MILPVAAAAGALALAVWAWPRLQGGGPGEAFVRGNGRIEATEVDVATKLPGRLQEVLVGEGDFVRAGQPLARMQVQSLEAQHAEAQARLRQAESTVASADAQVSVRESDRKALLAVVAQREAELDAARRRLARSQALAGEGASSEQELDDDRARVRSVEAALAAAQAQVAAAGAAVEAARTQAAGMRATVAAGAATVDRVKADLDDAVLVAPRAGRVQYRIAEAGEVLGAGGKVLNLVDLSDVYMTFFVPEPVAGRLALGSEVRLVLDAAPRFVIPARVSFVSSTAQFTPKTVETASERQKLMFRVRAQIDRELLQKHLAQVKTGLPGVAWVRLDAAQPWPAELAAKVQP
ncbi:HlyD family efflux transporter periplasmic adaptor subunit [Pelomonas sp. CA6]|nr:HlyD family efflux transporter periplasmic adaptor subunit [Pelomonas sp. CA6]MCH7343785.1 HlyD family efflux transporter periplasmic adaptor subunit [Pelomonas sp. CA6]